MLLVMLRTCIRVLEASRSFHSAHMASSTNDNLSMIDKFNGDNFGLWKFKMEMVLAAKDLWDIVDKSKSPPPDDAEESTKKKYMRRYKKALAIIAMNLVDKKMLHIKGCTGLVDAWETLYNIHETKSLSNILLLKHKFFIIKMEEGTDILEHINKVKSLPEESKRKEESHGNDSAMVSR